MNNWAIFPIILLSCKICDKDLSFLLFIIYRYPKIINKPRIDPIIAPIYVSLLVYLHIKEIPKPKNKLLVRKNKIVAFFFFHDFTSKVNPFLLIFKSIS